MIIVITIIIFVLGALLCLVKGKNFENCRPKIVRKTLEFFSRSDLNGYFVNTMVAFLGITTAIAFSNFNTARQEQKWTTEFIEDVLLTEFDTKITLMREAISGMNNDPGQEARSDTKGPAGGEISINVEEPSDPEKLFDAMKIYPITPVSSLDMLLTDSPYKYTISRYSYSALTDCRMNFTVQKARIDNSDSIAEMTEHLWRMSCDFERAYKIALIELRYQKNEISEDDVYREIDKLYDELRENRDSIVAGS